MVREEEDEAEDDEEDAVGLDTIVISFLALEADKQGEILDSLDDEARSHLLELADYQQLNPLFLTSKVVKLPTYTPQNAPLSETSVAHLKQFAHMVELKLESDRIAGETRCLYVMPYVFLVTHLLVFYMCSALYALSSLTFSSLQRRSSPKAS